MHFTVLHQSQSTGARLGRVDTPHGSFETPAFMPVGSRATVRGVTVGQLENGLRYYIRENDEPANRAELRLVVNVGSLVEDDDQLGLAHLLEHMAFNGSENFEKQEMLEFMRNSHGHVVQAIRESGKLEE